MADDFAWVYDLSDRISPKIGFVCEADRQDAVSSAALLCLRKIPKFNPAKAGPDGVRGYAAVILTRELLRIRMKQSIVAVRSRLDNRDGTTNRIRQSQPLIRSREDRERFSMWISKMITTSCGFDGEQAELVQQVLTRVQIVALGADRDAPCDDPFTPIAS